MNGGGSPRRYPIFRSHSSGRRRSSALGGLVFSPAAGGGRKGGVGDVDGDDDGPSLPYARPGVGGGVPGRSKGLEGEDGEEEVVVVRKEEPGQGQAPWQAGGKAGVSEEKRRQVSLAIGQTVLADWVLILGLIFGGCCSNAWTLEVATTANPQSGTLITFAQFVAVALVGLPQHLTFGEPSTSSSSHDAVVANLEPPQKKPFKPIRWLPRFKPLSIPLSRWAIQVVLFYATSQLNNAAFAYDIPMPVHIIFRSGGMCVNMLMGWLLRGKRYSLKQVLSVLVVTVGVIIATLSASSPSHRSSSSSSSSSTHFGGPSASSYAFGVLLLSVALVLSAAMGLWQEITYEKYGWGHWREGMFYSHFLSLPIFLLQLADLRAQIATANASPPTYWAVVPPSLARLWHGLFSAPVPRRYGKGHSLLSQPLSSSASSPTVTPPGALVVPSFYVPLLLNVLTQLLCISGVNRLTSRVSSLTVTLVLVVRKAVSLVISVLFVGAVGGRGGRGGWAMALGALMVGAGTMGYSTASSKKSKDKDRKRDKDDRGSKV